MLLQWQTRRSEYLAYNITNLRIHTSKLILYCFHDIKLQHRINQCLPIIGQYLNVDEIAHIRYSILKDMYVSTTEHIKRWSLTFYVLIPTKLLSVFSKPIQGVPSKLWAQGPPPTSGSLNTLYHTKPYWIAPKWKWEYSYHNPKEPAASNTVQVPHVSVAAIRGVAREAQIPLLLVFSSLPSLFLPAHFLGTKITRPWLDPRNGDDRSIWGRANLERGDNLLWLLLPVTAAIRELVGDEFTALGE